MIISVQFIGGQYIIIRLISYTSYIYIMKPYHEFRIVALSLVFCLGTNAQETESDWGFGFYLTPEYCYRTVADKSGDISFEQHLNELEEPKLGFTLELNANWTFSERNEITFGLGYSNLGYQMRLEGVEYGDSLLHSLYGFSGRSTPDKTTIKENIYFLNFPVGYKHSFNSQSQIRWFVTGLIEPNIFLMDVVKSIQYTGNEKEVDSFRDDEVRSDHIRRLNISARIDFGVEIYSGSRVSYVVSPNVRYMFYSYYKDYIVERNLYSVGISIGAIIH